MMYQEEVVLYAVSRSRSCRRARRLLATGKTILLPLVFLGGRLVGGLDEIVALERSGDLERLVRGRV